MTADRQFFSIDVCYTLRMDLHTTARAFLRDARGVLAVDENIATLEKRFSMFNIPFTEENRCIYRELLFSTPNIENFLSGALLSEEVFKQNAEDGTPFFELLSSKNILIAVHLSDDSSADFESRMQEYKSLAVNGVKCRALVAVGSLPTSDEFRARVVTLVACAKTAQGKNLVPLIGIELIQTGSHTAQQAETTLTEHLSILMKALEDAHVDMSGVVLETSMTSSGSENTLPASASEVGERTVRALRATVTPKIGGVLLFSDGESPKNATEDLNAIARLEPFPWPVAFCFSRALQEPVLEVWAGNPQNTADAQAMFFTRLALNVRADGAGYGSGMEAS